MQSPVGPIRSWNRALERRDETRAAGLAHIPRLIYKEGRGCHAS